MKAIDLINVAIHKVDGSADTLDGNDEEALYGLEQITPLIVEIDNDFAQWLDEDNIAYDYVLQQNDNSLDVSDFYQINYVVLDGKRLKQTNRKNMPNTYVIENSQIIFPNSFTVDKPVVIYGYKRLNFSDDINRNVNLLVARLALEFTRLNPAWANQADTLRGEYEHLRENQKHITTKEVAPNVIRNYSVGVR